MLELEPVEEVPVQKIELPQGTVAWRNGYMFASDCSEAYQGRGEALLRMSLKTMEFVVQTAQEAGEGPEIIAEYRKRLKELEKPEGVMAMIREKIGNLFNK